MMVPRLHLTDRLEVGAELRLAGDRAHYLRHVLRLRDGDAVLPFNAEDGEWRARLATAGRREVILIVEERRRAPADEAGPTLVFAPIRRNRLDWLVEKAVELGAARLVPVITRRTVVKPEGSARLEAIAREAAEQCGRLTVPPVDPPRPLEAWAEARDPAMPLLLADERGGGEPLLAAAARNREAELVVGPEGGWADEERQRLLTAPLAVPVSLGPRILRAETAALYLLTCWHAVHGGCSAKG